MTLTLASSSARWSGAAGRGGARAVHAGARGNPLALVELPRERSWADLAGGIGGRGLLAVRPDRESFLRRLEVLPADTQLLLLVAAAEPLGDPAFLRRAAEELGIAANALGPAGAAGFLEVDVGVRFRIRWRARRSTGGVGRDRRRAHRALADVTDRTPIRIGAPGTEPRRQRARTRGSPPSSSCRRHGPIAEGGRPRRPLLRAVSELTSDPRRRARRALGAARAKHLPASDAALAAAHVEAGPR